MSKTRRNKKPRGLLKAVEKLRLKCGERRDRRGFRQRKEQPPPQDSSVQFYLD